MSFHVRVLRLLFSRSGLIPSRAVSRLRPSGLWASPFVRRLARTSGRYRVSTVRTDRLASGCSPPHLRGPQLLIPFGDAVTFGFQPVKRLVERDLTSFSDALSGARAAAASAARGWAEISPEDESEGACSRASRAERGRRPPTAAEAAAAPLDAWRASLDTSRRQRLTQALPPHVGDDAHREGVAWRQNLRRADAAASSTSIEVENDIRRCPSPSGPNTAPGTLAIRVRSSSISMAFQESLPSRSRTFANR
jgi:hypothetical protein